MASKRLQLCYCRPVTVLLVLGAVKDPVRMDLMRYLMQYMFNPDTLWADTVDPQNLCLTYLVYKRAIRQTPEGQSDHVRNIISTCCCQRDKLFITYLEAGAA